MKSHNFRGGAYNVFRRFLQAQVRNWLVFSERDYAIGFRCIKPKALKEKPILCMVVRSGHVGLEVFVLRSADRLRAVLGVPRSKFGGFRLAATQTIKPKVDKNTPILGLSYGLKNPAQLLLGVIKCS